MNGLSRVLLAALLGSVMLGRALDRPLATYAECESGWVEEIEEASQQAIDCADSGDLDDKEEVASATSSFEDAASTVEAPLPVRNANLDGVRLPCRGPPAGRSEAPLPQRECELRSRSLVARAKRNPLR